MPAKMPVAYPSEVEPLDSRDSGYSSGSSDEYTPEIVFTKPHLQFLNRQLQFLEPQDVLRWCVTSLPHLFQTTAFGLTGLVTLDMLSKLNVPRPQMVDLVFLDTLHHFRETLDLVDRVRAKYPLVNVHIYKPQGVESEEEFAQKYGGRLWETDDQFYDWVAKVEPAQRAYRDLNVHAVLTGRRRSQGGKRGDMDIIEVDEAGLIKINPLANWSFDQVKQYIQDNEVPYNVLLDRGYKSIGDYHSTQPVSANEDERSGRWKGQQKTECGIHNPRSKYAQFLMDMERKRQEEALSQMQPSLTTTAQ
ncbi:putative 3'-phosphoadenosine-5'-phosphosulfate reductase Met16 [Aspergillus campestris IBT 28561]|uniref:phosphoadenylyl-sulfate reductase (thioredoxin) n=1 Tax=Aspergillus campestris (strain IBT 28561) TaxID=1392248 RepID=A0A2I1DD56_ASPC2|nr:putative 3'-phosphoadenosine-5'-phosphosulfate reductase Met16 [Aspergillus campestris IBT 28561]PKY07807.1 putative 3'-phosphoadenosine-5'-phosphosulfate reductase Met16 [Aspergillus campestris IBT 28561]